MADTVHVNEIQCEEISISYVCARYPRELINHLLTNGHAVEMIEDGIFYISGNRFAIQIVINRALSKEKNLWLKNLTNKINDEESIEQLIREYKKNKDNKLYSSIMDILVRANETKFREVNDMCEALKELFKEELEEMWNDGRIAGFNQGIGEGRKEGRKEGTRIGAMSVLTQLVRDGLLSLSVAAERAQMSEEEFQKQLQ